MVLFRRTRLLYKTNSIFLRPTSRNKDGTVFHVKFMSNDETLRIQLSNGTSMILSTGKYARFTSGSVTATLGNTSVMSTVVRKNIPAKSSMIPLHVNYRQKAAAIGRIPTNFLRRELGQTDHEILTSRIIDRSLRPLFPPGYMYETQIVCNLLAIDGINDPEVLSINAASAALSLSDIPWYGPVGAVRIGFIDKQYTINPTKRDLQQSTLNLVVACTSKNILVMMEGSADEILEPTLIKAIKLAAKECQTIVNSIEKLQLEHGKRKISVVDDKFENVMEEDVEKCIREELHDIFTCYSHDKLSRDNAISEVREKFLTTVDGSTDDIVEKSNKAFNNIVKETFRSLILETAQRCDGRGSDDLRDIQCQVNLFQPLHGSAMFQRGQTQVLCTVTLDSIESSLKMDAISTITSGIKEKNFFLHYEFPPYAVNEVGKLTGADRREVGHGTLAERGLRAVIPTNYPFAIRLTSEVLESNGSSSMASVCGGSLALMDAGIPVKAAVAGVAMGLISKPNTTYSDEADYKILTDISGIEDYFGDMDFKIAGTKKGFTAIQVDVKVCPGVPLKVINHAVRNAGVARNRILNIMNDTISLPTVKEKASIPVLDTLEVPVHQRGRLVGVGGVNIKRIHYETGVSISMDGDTKFSIFAPNQTAMDEAKLMINEILSQGMEPSLNFGDIYTARIIEICETGVLVSLYPTMVPTLLPNSQLDHRKVLHPSALGLKVGDDIQVKYFGRDPVNGRMRLSRKVLQQPVTIVRNLNEGREAVEGHQTSVPEAGDGIISETSK